MKHYFFWLIKFDNSKEDFNNGENDRKVDRYFDDVPGVRPEHGIMNERCQMARDGLFVNFLIQPVHEAFPALI
jgi:hypothetical protein